MRHAEVNGIELFYRSYGDDNAPAILFIMGLGAEMKIWPKSLYKPLVKAGYRVILFDNRDIGQSSRLEDLGEPSLTRVFLAKKMRMTPRPPYSLEDMADDAVGLLNALGIPEAHLVGASMGGMIAQIIAANYPKRVLSLASIMSTTSDPKLPMPQARVLYRMLFNSTISSGNDEAIDEKVRTLQLIGSKTFPTRKKKIKKRLKKTILRDQRAASGIKRQTAAVISATSREHLLKQIQHPTLIIHGNEDPLIPLECGVHTASCINSARLKIIEGMGHDFPKPLIPTIRDALIGHLVASNDS